MSFHFIHLGYVHVCVGYHVNLATQIIGIARPARSKLLTISLFVGMATCVNCEASSGRLVDACSYSFADLFQAARAAKNLPAAPPLLLKSTLTNLYAQERETINDQVQEWATAAGWHTELQIGSNGEHYLGFSPKVDPVPSVIPVVDDAKSSS